MDEKFSDADRKNELQGLIAEAMKCGVKPNDFILGVKFGYLLSCLIEEHIDPKDKLIFRYKNDIEKINHYIKNVLGEFETEDDDPEIDLDGVIEEMLRQNVDKVDEFMGDPEEEVSEQELDELANQLRKEIEEEQTKEAEYIMQNAQRYKGIYHQLCDFMTSNFDKEISELDTLDDQTWDQSNEKKKRMDDLRGTISRGSSKKLRELFNNDEKEIKLFQKWLHNDQDSGGDGPLGDFWTVDA